MSDDFSIPFSVPDNGDAQVIAKLNEKLAAAEARIGELEQKIVRLKFRCDTLAAHTGLSGEEIIALLTTAEKQPVAVLRCTQCGKVIQRGCPRCIYCGAVHVHSGSAVG